LSFTVWVVTAGIAWGALAISQANASVKIGASSDFTFYLDPAAAQPLVNITLPDVPAGGTSAFTVYVKNIGIAPKTISAGTNSLTAAQGTLTLTFDSQAQKVLAPGMVAKVVGTFNAVSEATAGTVNFSFSVNAADVTTTLTASTTTNTTVTATTVSTTTAVTTSTTIDTSVTTTKTTTTTPTVAAVSYATSIQPVFRQFCTNCHGNSGGVNLSSYSATMSSGSVVAGNAAGSRLYRSVTTGSMRGYGMSAAQITALANWINQGAPNN
jgi:hypothetical protein